MRRQLVWLVAATISVVLLAFLVPLGLLVRNLARSSALNEASLVTQALVPVVGLGSAEALRASVAQVTGDSALGVTVFLGGGEVVGDPAPRDAAVAAASRSGTASVTPLGADEVVLQPVLGRADGAAVIRVLVPASRLDRGVARAWFVLAALAAGLFAVALLLADRMGRALLRPLGRLADVAERLERGELEARVVPEGTPEIREVGTALNRLAGRIGELLAGEREAVADLSHRLRTPVTLLRLDAEALADPVERDRIGADVDELERHVDSVIREARRPVREGLVAECDAVAVVAERADFWSALADEQGRGWTVELPTGAAAVRVDARDLAAAVDALLGNVFAHTPEGVAGCVRVLARPGGGAIVEIADSGPGLPAYGVVRRGESGSGSTGLGLDIADRTAKASGGRLEVDSAPGRGTTVRLLLGPPVG